ncbi:hypothetical protein BD289DRAFT_99419 [Coniella lustricola]|uniref:Uncharacterized protein n=1 Tax=Coniella lustricola TaxID=2025994 RepID=A0A2T3AN38_9PEZI|nr:hypothetical protein BD289DRAFT_99419 [Coniella lustricola]
MNSPVPRGQRQLRRAEFRRGRRDSDRVDGGGMVGWWKPEMYHQRKCRAAGQEEVEMDKEEKEERLTSSGATAGGGGGCFCRGFEGCQVQNGGLNRQGGSQDLDGAEEYWDGPVLECLLNKPIQPRLSKVTCNCVMRLVCLPDGWWSQTRFYRRPVCWAKGRDCGKRFLQANE